MEKESVVPEPFTPQQKTEYFSQLAAGIHTAFSEHIKEGLWERTPDGDRDWGNVSEHCLVEVARVDAFAVLLGLSDEVKKTLRTAAALHDVLKKKQISYIKEHGKTYQAFDDFARISHDELLSKGLDEKIVRLIGSVGHESLTTIEPLVARPDLTEFELAQLVLHYVDDYTVDAKWAEGVSTGPEGNRKNDLDRRMDKNESNPNYATLNEEGRNYFNGETSYRAQRRIGRLVEAKIGTEITKKTGLAFDPIDLPTLIDDRIKAEIQHQSK